MTKESFALKIISVILVLIISPLFSVYLKAAPRTINYQWVVLDANSNPITDPLTFRFSLWKESDFVTSDISNAWAIVNTNVKYAWYFEVQNVTPDVNWNFNTAIWIITPLPVLNPSIHKYLQVEIKKVWDPDTKFQILDVDSNINNTNDRKLLSSAPYAITSESLDSVSVWFWSWQLAPLNSSGQLNTNVVPNAVNSNSFTLNNSNIAWDVRLIFGQLLSKVLKWASAASRFELWDSLYIYWNFWNDWNVNLWSSSNDKVLIAWNLAASWSIYAAWTWAFTNITTNSLTTNSINLNWNLNRAVSF